MRPQENSLLKNAACLIVLTIAICLSPPVVAQTIDLGGGLTVTQAQIDELKAKLPKSMEDEVFYHWAADERAWRWIKQGHVDQGEMDFLNKPSGELQSYGPGLYLANNPKSSEGFGTVPTAIEIKAGTPQYDEYVIREVLRKTLTKEQSAILGTHINFVKSISSSNGWFLTNSAANTTHVSYGGRFQASAKTQDGALQLQKIIAELGKQDPQKYGYLASMLHLMNYQDGVNFVHSLVKNPGNPWAEFDPTHFETYRQTAERAMTDLANGKSLQMASHGRFLGADQPKAWAQSQVDVFEELHHQALGQPKGNYRTTSIVAGGDVEGGYAYATKTQLAELEANPYLQIESLKDPNHDLYRVKIKYPNIEDYSRLEGLLAPELLKEIQSHGDLSKLSATERGDLQKKFLKGLVESRLESAAGKPYDEALYRDFISIHPFDDGNGRTVHLMQRLGAVEAGQKMPYFAISDLDLLTSPKVQADLLRESGKGYEKWLGDLLSEVQQAAQQHRIPRLAEYPHRERIAETMTGLTTRPTWTSKDFEEIEKRDWAPLLERWIGPKWQQLHPLEPADILENPEKFLKDGLPAHDLTTKIDTYVQKLVRAHQRYALESALQSSNKMFLPSFVASLNEAALKEPQVLSSYFVTLSKDLWRKLKDTDTLTKLPDEALHTFTIRSFGLVPWHEYLSEKQLAAAIESIPKSTDAESLVKSLTGGMYWNPFRETRASPEIKKTVDALFNVKFDSLNPDAKETYKALLVVSLRNHVAGPNAERVLKASYSSFSGQDVISVYDALAMTSGDPAAEGMRKFAIDEGLKKFKDEPLKYLESISFLETADGTTLDKRQLLTLVKGFRTADGHAIGLKEFLEKKQLSDANLNLFEKELRKAISSQKTPSEYFYAVLSAFGKKRPDSDVIQAAEDLTKDDKLFFRKTNLWTKKIENTFLNDPSQFSRSGSYVIDALERLNAPPKRIDEILKTVASFDTSRSMSSAMLYAAKIESTHTQEFDKYVSEKWHEMWFKNGFIDYAKSRPALLENIRDNLDGKDVIENFSRLKDLVEGDPQMTKAFFKAAEDLLLKSDLGANSSISRSIENSGSTFWELAKAQPPGLMTAAQHDLFVRYFGNPDEVFTYILKGPKKFQDWQKARTDKFDFGASGTRRWVHDVAKKIMEMKNPPPFIRDVLVTSLSEDVFGEQIRRIYENKQDDLSDWQKDVYKKALQRMSKTTLAQEAAVLKNADVNSKTFGDLARIYIQNGGPLKKEVRALVNIYDRLQKLGIEVDTSDPAEIDKIAHTILQGEWSKAELESYLNRHSGNAVLQSVLKQSQLSPTQQQLIITTRNGSYWETASHTKENADLLEQLVKGHGKLSEGKINTWVKHGACAGGLTRFFRRIGEAFDI